MKSNAIIRIVIWSIVLLALIGTLGAFMTDELYLRDYTPAETAIPVPLATTPQEVLPNEETLLLPADTIREIEIEWVAGDIVILGKDVDYIYISESDVTDDEYSMVFQTVGEKLEIQFCVDRLMPDLGISHTADLSKDLYIEVPKYWEGKSIEIDSASTNVEMYNITLEEMDIDGADGTGDFQNCHISDLDIDAASADVYYQGTLERLDFDAASASFIGDLQNTPNRIDMDSMSGKLDIALPEDCGFTLTMDGMSCHLSSDFYGTSMKNGSHVYGDGRCRINMDGMDCDVNIRKLDTIYVDPTLETAAPCTTPDCSDPNCAEHGHMQDICQIPDCTEHSHNHH